LEKLRRAQGSPGRVERLRRESHPRAGSITLNGLLAAVADRRWDVVVFDASARMERKPWRIFELIEAAERRGVRVVSDPDRIDTHGWLDDPMEFMSYSSTPLHQIYIRSVRARRSWSRSRSSGRNA
jgi:hypothetical protein